MSHVRDRHLDDLADLKILWQCNPSQLR